MAELTSYLSKLAPKPERILDDALARHDLFARALFERPESLSQFLPYDEYLPEFRLFRQKDCSLGVVYEVTLCEHETKTGEEIINLLTQLQQWFRLTEDLTLSLLFEQTPMSAHDPYWDELLKVTKRPEPDGNFGRDLIEELFRLRIDTFKTSAQGEESVRGFHSPIRRKLYLSIRNFKKNQDSHLSSERVKEALGNPHRTLSREVEAFLRQLRAFNHSLSQFEFTSPLSLKRLGADELASILRRTLNPVTYYQRPFAPVNPNVSLSEQLVYCSSSLDYPGITREGLISRTLSLKSAPSFAYPGAMAYFLSLSFPFRICLNISFPTSPEVKRHFGLKEFFLQNAPSARSRRQKAEIAQLQERLLRDDRVLSMTFTVLLEATTEEALELQTKECLARFQQRLECEAIVENEIGLGLWLNALPLAYQPIADFTTRRAIRILKSDLVHFLPVFDSYRGSSHAQSLFVSREGGLAPFDIKSLGNSHMTAVLGDTGSGKSSQVIEFLKGEMRREPRPIVFVLDHRTSYGMLARYLNSEITTYERDQPLASSPFKGPIDEEKVQFLVYWLKSAIQLTSPSFALEAEHQTCLAEAIRQANQVKLQTAGVRYREGELVGGVSESGNQDSNLNMDDVISALGNLTGQPEYERYAQVVEDLSKKLRPFYSDGIYASFFRRTAPTQQASSSLKDLYVYDIDGLASDTVLQTLVAMSVVDEIRRMIATPEARARGGWIVFEEFAVLGTIPILADFMKVFGETMRKCGFFFFALTPNPLNFFLLPVGRALWALSDHYIFMAMKEDNVNYIVKNSDLLNEADAQIVKSLRTILGYYADFFYIHKDKVAHGASRNVPLPQDLWLTPNHRPDQQEALRTIEQFPNDPLSALQSLVARFPYGTTEIQKDAGPEKNLGITTQAKGGNI